MPKSPSQPNEADIRQRALSRWDNEGGALAQFAPDVVAEIRELTNAELVHLRIRVIALENLMIAVLAEGSDRQRDIARQMADYITPRPGHSPHPLTTQAAHHMTEMVGRALHYRSHEP